jgi:GDP-L-fucose synthase
VNNSPPADIPIVVTGANGFLGRVVVSRLKERGYQNVVPALHSEYDLVRPSDVERLYTTLKPRILIQLAAIVGGIEANSKHPGSFFYQNLMMGVNMVEAARLFGLDKFVQIGTACSYPKFTPVPFKEDEVWNGYPEETNAPYGLAKRALLVQAQAYREQYGLNIIYLIPGNLYGPGDNFNPASSHVIPALIKKFCEAKDTNAPSVEVWGTGKASREFLYVADAAEGIILATENYDSGDPVNLGSGNEISIADLVELIRAEVGYEGEVIWNSSKPDGQPRRALDTSRAEKYFGFKAKTRFAEGLRNTIDWYRSTLVG